MGGVEYVEYALGEVVVVGEWVISLEGRVGELSLRCDVDRPVVPSGQNRVRGVAAGVELERVDLAT